MPAVREDLWREPFVDKIDFVPDLHPQDVAKMMGEIPGEGNVIVLNLMALDEIDGQSGLKDIFDLLEEPFPG
jgi:hypothetical protein